MTDGQKVLAVQSMSSEEYRDGLLVALMEKRKAIEKEICERDEEDQRNRGRRDILKWIIEDLRSSLVAELRQRGIDTASSG